jgi:hypothetical protein
MITTREIQKNLFEQIRNRLSPNISLVYEISELLGLSYDSAYRRMRGQKELSLEEVGKICLHFGISIDELFSHRANNVIFTTLAVGRGGIAFDTWLQTLLAEIQRIYDCRNRQIIYSAKDVPVFYYFEFPEIASFKFFFWRNVLIPSEENKVLKFLPEVSPELFDTGRKLLACYTKIPVIEIWSEDTISSITRQVDYCMESGFFARVEDALKICDVIHLWLDHVQSQAEHGFQYLRGREPEGIEDTYRLYHNEILVNDNNILVTADGRKTAYLTYNVISQIITSDPAFCGQIETSLHNLMQKSTLISGTSAKERYQFFNSLHEKVRHLQEKANRMI